MKKYLFKCTGEHFDCFRFLFMDTNLIHEGERGVVYGAMYAGFVSHIVGADFPGQGSIIVSSEYKFKNKAFKNDVIEAIVISERCFMANQFMKICVEFRDLSGKTLYCLVDLVIDIRNCQGNLNSRI